VTPIIYFLSNLIFTAGDETQFVDGKYWNIAFIVSYILRGLIISIPVLVLNLILFRQLLNSRQSETLIRLTLGTVGIIAAFGILILYLKLDKVIYASYSLTILMASLLLRISKPEERN
jgi:heme A synthase